MNFNFKFDTVVAKIFKWKCKKNKIYKAAVTQKAMPEKKEQPLRESQQHMFNKSIHDLL